MPKKPRNPILKPTKKSVSDKIRLETLGEEKLKELSEEDKKLILGNWHASGNYYGGRYLNVFQMAELVGSTVAQIDEFIERVDRQADEKIEKRAGKSNLVLIEIENTRERIREDRALARQQLVLVDKQIAELEKRRETIKDDNKPVMFKYREMSCWSTEYKTLMEVRQMALAAMFRSTTTSIQFLELFARNTPKDGSPPALAAVATGGKMNGDSPVVTRKTAIELLDQHHVIPIAQTPIDKISNQPRNPNKGFEEFVDPEAEPLEEEPSDEPDTEIVEEEFDEYVGGELYEDGE